MPTPHHDGGCVEQVDGKNVDGSLTLAENIADNGGIKISYEAFLQQMQSKGTPANDAGSLFSCFLLCACLLPCCCSSVSAALCVAAALCHAQGVRSGGLPLAIPCLLARAALWAMHLIHALLALPFRPCA